MPKNKLNVRSLVDQYQANCDRISQIADTCEKEQRERTEAETKEYEALVRENQLLGMKLQAAAADHLRENPNARQDAEKILRENAAAGRKTEIMLVRDIMTVQDMSDMAGNAVIPLNVQDIIKPLIEGFILDKVGLPMPTGLAGDYVWPTYEMVEATVLAEGATITDTKIPFGKLSANPARIGIAIPVTHQSLNQTEGLLERVVRELMPLSIRMLLNKIVFGLKAVNATAANAGLVGPYVGLKDKAVALSAVPTFLELNAKMKAKVLETGIDGEHLCWTMTKSMAAILEGTPINSTGIFEPMLKKGMLCGLPVYTTNEMRDTNVVYKKATVASDTTTWADYTLQSGDKVAYRVAGATADAALATITKAANGQIAEVTVTVAEYVGLGDWRYQPMGMFGSMRFVVDPYSKARQDAVDFVLNCDYGTKTLRPEAFILGKVNPA